MATENKMLVFDTTRSMKEQLIELNNGGQGDSLALKQLVRSASTLGIRFRNIGTVTFSYFELRDIFKKWDPTIDNDRFEELMQMIDGSPV